MRDRARIFGRPARFALEHCALLDGQRLVIDIAFDLARRLQHDAAAVHRSDDVAAHDDFLTRNAACDGRALADDDVAALDVAFDDAVDLNFALANEVADNRQVGADHGDGLRAIAGGAGTVKNGRGWKAGVTLVSLAGAVV